MKLTFLQSNKQNWGDLQKQISDQLVKCLAGKQDFEVEFSEVAKSKSPKALRGYWRICGLLVPCFQKSHGQIFDKTMVSDLAKISTGYCIHRKGVALPKSLTKITSADISLLIEKLYFMCETFKLKDYELLPDELRDLNNYFK